MSWFPIFLFLCALGITGAMATVPPKEIGNYFFKMNGTIALAALAVALLMAKPWKEMGASPMHIFAALSSIAFLSLTLLQNVVARAARQPIRMDAVLMPVSAGIPYAVFAAVAMRAGLGDGLLLAAHFLTAAAAIGFTLVTMILGHWYLQNAALSFDILRKMTRLLIAALVAKAAVSAVYFAMNAGRYVSMLTHEFDGMLIGVRLGVGLVVMLALAAMAHSCARIKSNQSATGILYVATIFILIGELDSLYLTLGRGLPV